MVPDINSATLAIDPRHELIGGIQGRLAFAQGEGPHPVLVRRRKGIVDCPADPAQRVGQFPNIDRDGVLLRRDEALEVGKFGGGVRLAW
ncbi:hypothetical protein [Arthrobacter psychrolactophilus]